MHLAVETLRPAIASIQARRRTSPRRPRRFGKIPSSRAPAPNLRNELTAADHHRPIVEMPPPLSLHWQGEDDAAAFAARLAAQPGIANAFIACMAIWARARPRWCATCCARWASPGASKPDLCRGRAAPGAGPGHLAFRLLPLQRSTRVGGCRFRDLFASPGLKLAEWPNNASGLIPVADIAIYIEAEDDHARHVTLQAHTPRRQRHCKD